MPFVNIESTLQKTKSSSRSGITHAQISGFDPMGILSFEWEIGEIESSLRTTDLDSTAVAVFATTGTSDKYSPVSGTGRGVSIIIKNLQESEHVTFPLTVTVSNEILTGGTETATDTCEITLARVDSEGFIYDRLTKPRMYVVNGKITPQRILNSTFQSLVEDKMNNRTRDKRPAGLLDTQMSLAQYTENKKLLKNYRVEWFQNPEEWVKYDSSNGIRYWGRLESDGRLTVIDHDGYLAWDQKTFDENALSMLKWKLTSPLSKTTAAEKRAQQVAKYKSMVDAQKDLMGYDSQTPHLDNQLANHLEIAKKDKSDEFINSGLGRFFDQYFGLGYKMRNWINMADIDRVRALILPDREDIITHIGSKHPNFQLVDAEVTNIDYSVGGIFFPEVHNFSWTQLKTNPTFEAFANELVDTFNAQRPDQPLGGITDFNVSVNHNATFNMTFPEQLAVPFGGFFKLGGINHTHITTTVNAVHEGVDFNGYGMHIEMKMKENFQLGVDGKLNPKLSGPVTTYYEFKKEVREVRLAIQPTLITNYVEQYLRKKVPAWKDASFKINSVLHPTYDMVNKGFSIPSGWLTVSIDW